MDVMNQVLLHFILASFKNDKLENADLHNIASQLKVTHYDCREMTENKLNALNQVSKRNIARENLEVSETFSTRNQCNNLQSEQWHCGSGDDSRMDAHHAGITTDLIIRPSQ